MATTTVEPHIHFSITLCKNFNLIILCVCVFGCYNVRRRATPDSLQKQRVPRENNNIFTTQPHQYDGHMDEENIAISYCFEIYLKYEKKLFIGRRSRWGVRPFCSNLDDEAVSDL